jgi:Phosphate-selective porin O and P
MLRILATLVVAHFLVAPAVLLAQGPVRWSGYIQARETYRDEQGFSASINRARLSASGGGAKDVTWRIQGEFRQGSVGTGRASVALQDAFVRYKPGAFGITAGQFKTPFTREFITSLSDIETADRSTVVDSLAPKRDIGVMADYNFGSDATVFLGLFNGEGQNVTSNADSNYLIVGRVTGRPVPFVTLGANVADYEGDSTRYGVDVSIEYMGAIFRGEYVIQNREGVDLDDEGWYVQGAYRVVPWAQLVLKLEDFSRDGISFASRNNATTGGVNVEFPGGKVRLLLNYVSREIGEPGKRTGSMIGQAQVKF